jgi:hypothetical protein
MLAQRDLNALFLSQNDLNSEAISLLAEGLGAQTRLKVLSVAHNNL